MLGSQQGAGQLRGELRFKVCNGNHSAEVTRAFCDARNSLAPTHLAPFSTPNRRALKCELNDTGQTGGAPDTGNGRFAPMLRVFVVTPEDAASD